MKLPVVTSRREGAVSLNVNFFTDSTCTNSGR